MTDHLSVAVERLLRAALDRALDPASHQQLDEAMRRLHEPLRLAIAGRVKAGKSTLLNALVGEELAATDAGECTRLVTWYRDADTASVVAHRKDGREDPRPFSRDGGALEIDLGGSVDSVDHLRVSWPSSRLRELTLIDTPGIASLSKDVSERTSVLLSTDDHRPAVADAVLYLLRHTHSSDVRFLEAFHDDELARGTPVNAVAVLSRADEIGSCRLDALEVASGIAVRYQQDIRLRRLCPLVVPVAGLLGQAGTALREEEYRALARIAALPAGTLEPLLLTADRMGREDAAIDITAIERRHLLDRLGLFGTRLCVDLIRRGEVTSATELADELTRASGLGRLRAVLLSQFTERSRLLKCRSALAVARAVVRRGGCSDQPLLAASIEEVTTSAHEFAEIRLLNDVRSGAVEVPEQLVDEMERLLGGSGHSPAIRLGLPEGGSDDETRAAALAARARWQRVAESPLSSRALAMAARGVTRTCEGLLAAMVPAG